MSEEAPAAPAAPAAAPAEPSTPTTTAPEAAPASVPEQPAQAPATTPTEGANNYFTNEQLAEMQRMFENNGGYDKAWGKMKEAISRPQKLLSQPSHSLKRLRLQKPLKMALKSQQKVFIPPRNF